MKIKANKVKPYEYVSHYKRVGVTKVLRTKKGIHKNRNLLKKQAFLGKVISREI